ncbi:MAG TPA: ATP-binding cassette domain-containing protein [Thermoanaerobaculia bacterium]|nr:ATP-binding cassette domain-containing protein [Thermoanaerobaculia bacterium]
MASSIEFRGVSVDAILHDLDLRIGAGEAVAFIGRSGAGKTTTLRLINGLASPSRGEVIIDGTTVADFIPLRRRTGYIIQGSGLFPHRTVYENVATLPRLLKWEESRTRDEASRLLDRLGLPFEKFATRYPRSLSGGEQQRVGIARAIVARPGILLCDEPFGALDPIVRRELQDSFTAIREERNATIVFVTHDLAEAMRVAERVVVFDGGRIVADTSARELPRHDAPAVRALVAAASLPS